MRDNTRYKARSRSYSCSTRLHVPSASLLERRMRALVLGAVSPCYAPTLCVVLPIRGTDVASLCYAPMPCVVLMWRMVLGAGTCIGGGCKRQAY
eukprot:2789082-Rhodomonas_salina.2